MVRALATQIRPTGPVFNCPLYPKISLVQILLDSITMYTFKQACYEDHVATGTLPGRSTTLSNGISQEGPTPGKRAWPRKPLAFPSLTEFLTSWPRYASLHDMRGCWDISDEQESLITAQASQCEFLLRAPHPCKRARDAPTLQSPHKTDVPFTLFFPS